MYSRISSFLQAHHKQGVMSGVIFSCKDISDEKSIFSNPVTDLQFKVILLHKL
jgi:hypothetical protein